MHEPTREELDRLADEAHSWSEVFAGEGTDESQQGLLRIEALLRAYPLPVEGERAELAEFLEALSHEMIYDNTAKGLRRAAFLLPRPVAGASLEAVIGIINEWGAEGREMLPRELEGRFAEAVDRLSAAVRALPEAEPEHDPVLCDVLAESGRRDAPEATPPAQRTGGVSREAVERLVEDALPDLLMLAADQFVHRGRALLSAVRVLPEARPSPLLAVARELAVQVDPARHESWTLSMRGQDVTVEVGRAEQGMHPCVCANLFSAAAPLPVSAARFVARLLEPVRAAVQMPLEVSLVDRPLLQPPDDDHYCTNCGSSMCAKCGHPQESR